MKWWIWVAVLVIAVSIVLRLVYGGDPPGSDLEGAPGASSPAPATPAQARATPLEAGSPVARAVHPSVDLQGAAPSDEANVERGASSQPTPSGVLSKSGTLTTPWESISPGTLPEFFDFKEAKQLVSGLNPVSQHGFRNCIKGYKPPPGTEQLEVWSGTVVLDIQSSTDGFEIVDASLTDANFGDEVLEACLLDVYRGVYAPAESIRAGLRHRLEWPIIFGLRDRSEDGPRDRPSGG